ncbi:hypothetical protein BKA66DRAFT_548266 [Pyrenochaeta sp. MPI-SDFR-AT-0127]|nr:hypothetical protein BKA66DRAFT_548266 [Pyrenochaeta sp. MPI-SDFR-AT-0127]
MILSGQGRRQRIPGTFKRGCVTYLNFKAPLLWTSTFYSTLAVILLMMKFHLSILVVCVSNALALVAPRAAAVDCPPNKLDFRKCIPYVENKDIDDISFSLYTWTKTEAPDSPSADSEYLKPLQLAAATALPVYAKLMKTKTDFNEPDQSVCSIRVAGYGLDKEQGDVKSVQQSLAHELYHCVQRTFGIGQPIPTSRLPNNWWFEGSAEYFGNIFFPNTNPAHMQHYHPRFPLYAQDPSIGYAGALFFQHLSNALNSDEVIHKWVVGRKDTESSTPESEQQKLSFDNFITKAFPSFATQFTDGLIRYQDYTPVVSTYQAETRYKELILPRKPGVYKFTTWVYPFTILSKVKMTFPTKRKITFIYKAPDAQDSSTVLRYRKVTDTTWKTAAKGADNKVDDDCSELLFLATSTSGVVVTEPFPVTLTFTVQRKAPKKRKVKRDDPVDNPIPTVNPQDNPDLGPSVNDPEEITVVSLDPDDGDDDEEGDSCSNKCIVGTWNLDIPSMQAFLTERLSGVSAATITNLAVTGSSSLIVKASLSSNMTFNSLDIGYDGSASGFSFHTVIDITGSVAGTIQLGDNAFTWVDPQSQGTVKTTTTVQGFGDPIEMDLPVEKQYGPTTQVQYTCKENKLQTSGYVNGAFTWAYSWTREGGEVGA